MRNPKEGSRLGAKSKSRVKTLSKARLLTDADLSRSQQILSQIQAIASTRRYGKLNATTTSVLDEYLEILSYNLLNTIRESKDYILDKEPSGAQWVSRFIDSKSTSDLVQRFQTGVNNFIAAMTTGGATVTIGTTLRLKERAYLMHYAWMIAKEGTDPQTVPDYTAVNIDWAHLDASGNPDLPASQSAAQDMVDGYQIVAKPSLTSRHTEGRAIDMTISWSGDLTIADANGNSSTISTTPRSGENTDLQKVGASYGVMKATFAGDPPHWSDDGH